MIDLDELITAVYCTCMIVTSCSARLVISLFNHSKPSHHKREYKVYTIGGVLKTVWHIIEVIRHRGR